MSKADAYLKKVINEEANPMLIENSLIKIESAIKNILDWTADIPAEIAEKIKSNVNTATKNINLIKKQLQ